MPTRSDASVMQLNARLRCFWHSAINIKNIQTEKHKKESIGTKSLANPTKIAHSLARSKNVVEMSETDQLVDQCKLIRHLFFMTPGNLRVRYGPDASADDAREADARESTEVGQKLQHGPTILLVYVSFFSFFNFLLFLFSHFLPFLFFLSFPFFLSLFSFCASFLFLFLFHVIFYYSFHFYTFYASLVFFYFFHSFLFIFYFLSLV